MENVLQKNRKILIDDFRKNIVVLPLGNGSNSNATRILSSSNDKNLKKVGVRTLSKKNSYSNETRDIMDQRGIDSEREGRV
jgi:hypothetical protein